MGDKLVISAMGLRIYLRCDDPTCLCQHSSCVHCPAWWNHKHRDKHPSLNVNPGKNQPIVVHCFVCPDFTHPLQALARKGIWLSKQDIDAVIDKHESKPKKVKRHYTSFVEPWKEQIPVPNQIAQHVFEYLDGDKVIAAKERIDYDDGSKRFHLLDAWLNPSKGVKFEDLPLYKPFGFSEVEADIARWLGKLSPIMLVEGELCAEFACQRGFPAVSLAGGANQHNFGNALSFFDNREIILFPDNDYPGIQLMQRVAQALTGKAKLIRWLAPGWIMPGGDIIDYFEDKRYRADNPNELSREQLLWRKVEESYIVDLVTNPGKYWHNYRSSLLAG